MKTKFFIMALMAMVCLTANARGNKKENCDTAKCCAMAPIPGLELSDEDAAKLKDIYGRYMDEIKKAHESLMPACKANPDEGVVPIGEAGGERPEGGRPEGGKPGKPAKQLSDEEAEALIKAEIAVQREVLNIKEKYYDEFRTVLTPAQIRIIYSAQCKSEQRPGGPQRGGHPGGPQGGPEQGPRPEMPR